MAVEEHRTRGRETCKAISFVIRSERIWGHWWQFWRRKVYVESIEASQPTNIKEGSAM